MYGQFLHFCVATASSKNLVKSGNYGQMSITRFHLNFKRYSCKPQSSPRVNNIKSLAAKIVNVLKFYFPVKKYFVILWLCSVFRVVMSTHKTRTLLIWFDNFVLFHHFTN